MNSNVLLYHSNIPPDAPPDELDVLDEAAHFSGVLGKLGYVVYMFPFPESPLDLEKQIKQINPAFVVNLVETVLSSGRLIAIAPMLFEHFGVKYTGCNAEATYVTSNKILAKKILQFNNINTPDCITLNKHDSGYKGSHKQFILKSLFEHASYGMDEHVMKTYSNVTEINKLLADKSTEHIYFAEEYIDGREFNISLLGGPVGPQILPVAEICFQNYPKDKLRIVGYRSKWDEESFEYKHTVRTFDSLPQDSEFFEQLQDICIKCWKIFNLKGYARIDFRIDKNNVPYVLEINTNPCISPDSGFVAATRKAGLSFEEVIARIIFDANI